MLTCCRWALLGQEHKGHDFVEVEQAYDAKKIEVNSFLDNLKLFRINYKNALDKSEENIKESKSMLDASKESLGYRISECKRDYVKKYEDKIEVLLKSKEKVESALEKFDNSIFYIDGLLKENDKTKLVESFQKIKSEAGDLLENKDDLEVKSVVDPDDIDNELVPSFSSEK